MKPMSKNSVTAFTEIGSAYIDIAFDMPHLFKYLYLNEGSDYCAGARKVFFSPLFEEPGQTAEIMKLIKEKENQ